MTDAEYARLLEAQGGHCALCPNTPKTRRLHVDHDHATGEVRGLLCYVCNKYLPATRGAAWHMHAAYYIDPGYFGLDGNGIADQVYRSRINA